MLHLNYPNQLLKTSAVTSTLTVNITSSDSWTAASSSTACNLVPNQGTSNQSLSIVVEANLDEAPKNMTVVVTSGGIKKTISISQQGRSTTAGEYHYNLPVIFHVLYKDKNNPLQYVKQDRLAKILDTVNKLYKDKTKSVDMNLTFTLATTDEKEIPYLLREWNMCYGRKVTLSTVMPS